MFVIFSSILFFDSVFAKKNKILFKINNQIITSIDLLEETKYLTVINEELKGAKKNIIYEIYLFVNLDRNLENSYIKTSLQKEKIILYGDPTSFHGQNKQIYLRGSLEKY